MRGLYVVSILLSLMVPGSAQAKEKSNPGSWATTSGYPAKALAELREGTVYYKVVVGTDGRVKSCSIVRSSGHTDLDQAACSQVTARARFEPARNADGNPIEGTFENKVAFVIPRN